MPKKPSEQEDQTTGALTEEEMLKRHTTCTPYQESVRDQSPERQTTDSPLLGREEPAVPSKQEDQTTGAVTDEEVLKRRATYPTYQGDKAADPLDLGRRATYPHEDRKKMDDKP